MSAAKRSSLSLGRGSFIESFPLFGYDLSQYEVLFDVTSARPLEAAFKVEKRSNTRIGSSEDKTVTAEPARRLTIRSATYAGLATFTMPNTGATALLKCVCSVRA